MDEPPEQSACHKCRYFSTDADSDYCVGLTSFSMACIKNHFRIDSPFDFENTNEVRAALAHGDNCPDYEQEPDK